VGGQPFGQPASTQSTTAGSGHDSSPHPGLRVRCSARFRSRRDRADNGSRTGRAEARAGAFGGLALSDYARSRPRGGAVIARLITVVLAACVALLGLAVPAQAAFPGANGKIALDGYDGSDYEIYTINPDGTGEAQLTNNSARDSEPAWSADGKKILFSSNRTGTDAIWVMNADGSGQTQVTSPSVGGDSSPGWSPDGQSITFARTFPDGYGGNTNTCRSQLYVANANGSGATDISPSLLTNCSYSPEWSPDGALIAFVSTISTPSGNLDEDVWTIKPDGTGATQLSHHPFGSCSDPLYTAAPSWTPDGKAMTFYADCNAGGPVGYFLVSINRDGSGQQIVGEPTSLEPAWSPDGRKIAYMYGPPFELRVADSDFTNPVTIRSTDSGSPDWQPIATTPGPHRSDYKNAAKFCDAERDYLGDASFRQKYGSNRNGANAYGKCVSSK
jgi:dipeptidyl aminopeptidase/acylaminoacyl peptidase